MRRMPLFAIAVMLLTTACGDASSGSESAPVPQDAGAETSTDSAVTVCEASPDWSPVVLFDSSFLNRTIGELLQVSDVGLGIKGVTVAAGRVFAVGIGYDPGSNSFGSMAYLAWAEDQPGASFKLVPIPELVGSSLAITSVTRDGKDYVEIAATRVTPQGKQDFGRVWEIDAENYDGSPLSDAQRIVDCTAGDFGGPSLASTIEGELFLGLTVYPNSGKPVCTVRGKQQPATIKAYSATVLFPIDGPQAGGPPRVFEIDDPAGQTHNGELAVASASASPRMFLSMKTDTSIFAFDWEDPEPKIIDMGGGHCDKVAAVGALGVFGGNCSDPSDGYEDPLHVRLRTSSGTSLVEQWGDRPDWRSVVDLHGAGTRLAAGGASNSSGLTFAGSPVRCATDYCGYAATVSFTGDAKLDRVVTFEGVNPVEDRAVVTAVHVGPCGELYAAGVFQGDVSMVVDGTVVSKLPLPSTPGVTINGSLPFLAKLVP